MEIIQKELNELTGSYNIVFHLRDVEGLTNHEAAEAFGHALNAVKSRIHKEGFF